MAKGKCPETMDGLVSHADISRWANVTKNTSIPFVHKFQTDCNKYLYDVNTSHILKVEQVVWDIISDFGRMSKDEILSKYISVYGFDAAMSGYNAIITAQKQNGLLLTDRPNYITMPYGEEALRKKLLAERMQLTLCVTEACNFRCSYCVYGEAYKSCRNHSNKMMSWKIARLAINEFLDHSTGSQPRSVSFYGGEPLCNIELIRRCISYVRQKTGDNNIYFALTTNGYLLKDDIADFLASENFSIAVSLDGPAPIHDRNRRSRDGSPTWNRVVTNIKTFVHKHPEYKTNGRIGIHVVGVPPIDMVELEEFFSSCNFLTENTILSLGWISTQDMTYFKSVPPEDRKVEGLDILYQEFVTNLEKGRLNKNPKAVPLKIQTALFQRTFLDFHKRGYSTIDHPHLPEYFCPLPTCIPGVRRTFVATDGTYYVCERIPNTKDMMIGNVHEGINVSKVRQILQKFVDLEKDDCRFCWCLPNCHAGCIATVIRKNKLSRDARRHACAVHRKITHRTIIDICRILEKNPHALDYMEKIAII